ncbi:tRNA adenosine(34) deaminase TadA [Thiomicrorhabdus sp. zzn3]|uniref:tRNA adenosine(34) deaminase TadA n=1 Tax=Thiomicrorhabdus sp. zzn3 TaxID=3039775 RepID=UPI002437207E|nr:tRNA adenosine(34) deaminase TadA [Thiomicrorhabdus sp. zzn3]MDG6777518.1 tRNA adenosine(34) deaminase TadA [Thiomicrorhabdus sp. zzn3]
MSDKNIQRTAPAGLSQSELDLFWMEQAYRLALRSQQEGEVPVGAVVVQDNQLIAEGWNRPIQMHDPTAHAEVMALRQAGEAVQNYRLVNTTLYVTLEPCPMCASAMVHARVKRLVYGAADLKTGAVDSRFNLVQNSHLNHQLEVVSGVMAEACGNLLSDFFKRRRAEQKKARLQESEKNEKPMIRT